MTAGYSWCNKRTLIGLLLMVGLSCSSAKAQHYLLRPEVIVDTSSIPENQAANLAVLEEDIGQMLLSYAPSVDVHHMPRHPIRTIVRLKVTEGDGFRYVGDLELLMLRPIYGEEEESVVLLVAEPRVPFEFGSAFPGTGLGSDVPESPLHRRIYYYVTLGAMYYYDSFAPLGGAPFLKYLQEQRTLLEEAWDGLDSRFSPSLSYLAPRQHLPELEGAWGNKFRELWYLYHREGLDSDTTDDYAEILAIVLEELDKLQRENASLRFAQLVADTKGAEIQQRASTASPSIQRKLNEWTQRLFPTIRIGL